MLVRVFNISGDRMKGLTAIDFEEHYDVSVCIEHEDGFYELIGSDNIYEIGSPNKIPDFSDSDMRIFGHDGIIPL